MNREIEERIVAMYFDNKDFEKNAQQTIKTLGELKENLNLDESVKGFNELDKAGKKLNLSQARNTVNNLKSSLGGISSALNKAFDIGTAPIRALDHFFSTFRSYVGRFVGFDLASKFVSSLESAMRQLTIAPLEAGWSMYQANIDSTKTIMSGTMQSYKKAMSETNADWTYNEAEHMQYVEQNLQKLSEYAQQTVFSLTDMTSNVGKFTNNNVDLETSVTAMEGIANMTAKAGQGAQQASMAMYNFSQALGVGKMTSIDWKSIENANLATTELKDLFIQTAAASGELKKEISKDALGKEVETYYRTVDKNGKKLAKNKWTKITAENFRDTLSEGWLTKDTLLKVFQLYSGEVNDIDTLAAWGFDTSDPEVVKQLFAIGEEAKKAATEVRTFQKMWDALTESVQSGWADSMKLIFGDMTEATEFWTTLNDKFDKVLSKNAEKRNDALKEWRGYTKDEKGNWVKLEGAVDGREDLVQGLFTIVDTITAVGEAFRSAWNSVFGELNGKKLQQITANFRQLAENFQNWLGSADDSESRLGKITAGLRGVLSIFKVVMRFVRSGFNLIKSVVGPVGDTLIDLFSNLMGFFDGMGELSTDEVLAKIGKGFGKLWDEVKKFFSPEVVSKYGENGLESYYGDSPFVKLIKNMVNDAGEKIAEWMRSVNLGSVWDALVNAWSWIKDTWTQISNWEFWGQIADFFGNTWEWVKQVTGTAWDFMTKPGEDGKTGFVLWIESVWDTLKTTWEEIKTAAEPVVTPIAEFLGNTWEWIKTTAGQAWDFMTKPGEDGKTGFTEWLGSVWDWLKTTWENIVEAAGPIAAPIAKFLGNTWEWIKATAGQAWDFMTKPGEDGKTGFTEWLGSVWDWLKTTWENIVEAAGPIAAPIAKFLGNTWEWIKSTAGQAWDFMTKPGEDGKTGFTEWLDNVWQNLKTTWEAIEGEAGPIVQDIGKFLGDTWGWITGFFNGTEMNAAEASQNAKKTESLVQPTKDSVGFLTQIIEAISGFFESVSSAVTGLTIPDEITRFLTAAGDFLKMILEKVTDVMNAVSKIATGQGSLQDYGTAALTFIPILIAKLAELFNNRSLSKIEGKQNIAQQVLELAATVMLIAGALALLTTVDTGKMLVAAGVVAALGTVLAIIMRNLALKNVTSVHNMPVTPWERIANNFIDGLEKIGMIAVAMAFLPDLIRTFGDVKKEIPALEGLDILNVLLGLGGLITSISIGLAVVNKISGSNGIAPEAAIKTAISVVGFVTIAIGGFGMVLTAIGALNRTIDSLSGQEGGTTTKSVTTFISETGEILGEIGAAINGFWMKLTGQQTNEEKYQGAKDLLNETAEQLEVFTGDKTQGITRILTLIGLLSQVVKDIPDAGAIGDFADQLDPLAEGLVKFGLKVSGFMVEGNLGNLSVADLESNIQKATELIKAFDIPDFSTMVSSQRTKVTYFKKGLDELSEFTDEDFGKFGTVMSKFVQAFNDAFAVDGAGMSEMSGSLMENLSAAIRLGMTATNSESVGPFDAMPIIDSIVQALGLGETAIATAVHNMVQAGIDNSGQGGYTFNPEGSGTGTGGMEGLEGITELLNNPSSVLGDFNMDSWTEMLYGKGGTSSSPGEGSILGQITQLSSQMEGIQFPDLGEKLAESFSFKDSETGEAIDLTAALKEELASLEEQMNSTDAFTVTIVPTIDTSKLTISNLRSMLGEDFAMDMPLGLTMPESFQIDFSGIGAELDIEGLKSIMSSVKNSIDASNRAIVAAVTSLGGRIDRVASAIGGMKITLNTGVIAGGVTPEVDQLLGDRAQLGSRTGVSPASATGAIVMPGPTVPIELSI